MAKSYFTYVVSNKSRRLYVGTTSQLQVYFEAYSTPHGAISREKEIKGWRREKKLRLILVANPDWADLSAEWKEDESWQAVPEAKSRPLLRRRDPGEP